jgi:hypothetical protein
MLFDGLEFVEALEGAVVAFVEAPVLDDGNIVAVDLVSGIVECLDGASKYGGIAEVELETVLAERLAGIDGFLDSCIDS